MRFEPTTLCSLAIPTDLPGQLSLCYGTVYSHSVCLSGVFMYTTFPYGVSVFFRCIVYVVPCSPNFFYTIQVICGPVLIFPLCNPWGHENDLAVKCFVPLLQPN